MVWNWYHFIAITILHINTRLQFSDTRSIPPMHGGFLLTSLALEQSYDSGLHHWHWGNLIIQGYITGPWCNLITGTGAILGLHQSCISLALGQSYDSRLHRWHWGSLMIQFTSLALGQSCDSRLHHWPWGNLMIQACITGTRAILWFKVAYHWHWGNLIIQSSPVRCQAIAWTSAGLLSIGHMGTNFSEIRIGIL